MIDQKQPSTSKMNHLRPKSFKMDLYKKREVQNENDNLVLKILKLRGNNSADRGKRCISVQSARSTRSKSLKYESIGPMRNSSSKMSKRKHRSSSAQSSKKKLSILNENPLKRKKLVNIGNIELKALNISTSEHRHSLNYQHRRKEQAK